ncbi:hypothetical protein [Mucilaginibacter sp. OK098]|uniref:hypothetical protein n=1 Tax=Mucilaginibacter sp. OK098 TaxID=1855297 RepID=UPI0009190A40|nr:hypothetical protein [Mucilaginibacter sp. OK098]SHM11339.1 hypothetical protein SAMN05216524_101845 [Mucilaginibacter sp. OK098]
MTSKLALFSVVFFFASAVSAQKITRVKMVTGYSINVAGDDFEGVIFNANYTSPWINLKRSAGIVYSVYNDSLKNDTLNEFQRFTPNVDDIVLAETLLRRDLKQFFKKLPSVRFVRGPNVSSHLEKYARQYFGLINGKGEKIILLNCFWDENIKKDGADWVNEFYHVYDGGNYYWEAKVNLATQKLFDFGVHGAI